MRCKTLVLMVIILFASLIVPSMNISADDNTLTIYLGDSTTARHHKAILLGDVSEPLSFKLKDGTVKSSSFSSTNTNSFVIKKENGKDVISALKEGTGYVELTVQTTNNKTYKEKLFVSVYKGVTTCTGITKSTIDAYRGASSNANVENEDAKGKITKGTSLDVIASCDDFYLIRTQNGRVFDDNKNTGFVKKGDIEIPISALVLNKTNLTMGVEDETKLTVNILPSITTEKKKVTWSTNNKNVIAVYSDGIIYAKKIGEAIVYAKSGSKTSECKVKVTTNSGNSDIEFNSKGKKLKSVPGLKYRYKFINNYKAFGRKYHLSSNLKNKLAKKLVAAGYFKSYKKAHSKISSMLSTRWCGSCYGMAITTALNKKKQINVRKYTKSYGKGHQINRVANPKYNNKVADIINYYHASQLGYNKRAVFYYNDDENGLKMLVRNAKKGYVQSFGFYMWKNKNHTNPMGHRILLLKYSKKKSSKKWYAIKCYDNSYSRKNRYIYVSKKYKNIRVDGWSKHYTIYGFDTNTDFSVYNKIKIK